MVASFVGHPKYARAMLLTMLGVAIVAGLLGFLAPFERMLLDVQTRLGDTPASGEITIVEIDAKSIEALEQWPWPRKFHAEALTKIAAADPRLISFDVDFSSKQSSVDDAALGAALEKTSATVILAAFEQDVEGGSRRTASLPLPALRASSFVGSANVMPDPDGAVRTYPVATEINGILRPSLATLTAEANLPDTEAVVIDYAIDPDTIGRLSFVDVLRGDFDPSAISGKRVLIGATAIELGDRYHIPGHGLLPGVVVQALAAETLLDETPLVPLSRQASALLALIAALPLVIMFGQTRRFVAVAAAGATSAVIVVTFLQGEYGLVLNMATPVAAWAIVLIAGLGIEGRLQFRRRDLLNPFTQLPNRRLLERELATDGSSGKALALVRVQSYDKISSAFGVEASQGLMLRVSERISFRSENAAVYQLSSNLFAVLVDSVSCDPEIWFAGLELDLVRVTEQGDVHADIRVNAGFDLPAQSADPFSSRIDRALLALSQAEEGKRRLSLSGQQDRDNERWRVGLANTLRKAIEVGHLRLVYQPKMCIRSGAIEHVEALVRWQDPERGPIYPDQFIPLAEANGSISDLTRFVITEAAGMVAILRQRGLEVGVAVNISTNDLADPKFVSFVAETLREAAIPPALLTMEITETGLIDGRHEALSAARELKALGLRLSIDDYGTGQSTMAYVEQFPADELKIDMSFVMKMIGDRSNSILVNSAIELAHALDMQVVAEGVENEEILAALRAKGCDYGQGYHIARPLEAEAMMAFLAEQTNEPQRRVA
ncbi:putative bifunctional diguanylate cyclase/phosphodiesterase [Pacificimonas sp. ICDLI1SI03]